MKLLLLPYQRPCIWHYPTREERDWTGLAYIPHIFYYHKAQKTLFCLMDSIDGSQWNFCYCLTHTENLRQNLTWLFSVQTTPIRIMCLSLHIYLGFPFWLIYCCCSRWSLFLSLSTSIVQFHRVFSYFSLFLKFINDLAWTQCPIHVSADDSTYIFNVILSDDTLNSNYMI